MQNDTTTLQRAVHIGWLGVVLALPATAIQAAEGPDRFRLEVEAAAGWQARNDVQIPNDASGTRFSIADTVGSGPVPAARVDFSWALNDRQELRFLVAPFGYEESGTLPGPVNFNGASFDAASPTEITYRFNSYRATWRYRVFEDEDWTVKLGVTGNIRQAEIALAQGGVSSSRTDVGFVPLLNVWAERRFAQRWRLVLDLDGLAAPQGRAFDIAGKVGYDLAPNLTLTAGLRMLDGGGDNDEVYNFARFYYGVASVIYRF
ncbi:MAG: hypothetical protein IPJ42_07900 [Betaproteobacteria bacterium]|nr:hypothetical protein [Betaproteobacteria bacterium]